METSSPVAAIECALPLLFIFGVLVLLRRAQGQKQPMQEASRLLNSARDERVC